MLHLLFFISILEYPCIFPQKYTEFFSISNKQKLDQTFHNVSLPSGKKKQ